MPIQTATPSARAAMRVSRRRPLALGIAALLLGAAPLHAQNQPAAPAPAASSDAPPSATNLNRIVVTAQKREQQEVDVPISISAFSGNFLHTLGITREEDLARYVPGLQMTVQSPNNPGYAIRGITTDDGSSNAASRVSIYQDGVDISRSRGSSVALFDMDRVEVLRGPQGTLFGRGAESGAISLIQNKANDTTSGGFTTEFGNYSYRQFQGYFNTPVSDNVDARVAVYDSQHDGYIKNTSGGDLDGEDTKAIRASVHIKTGTQSSIDLIANYQRDSPPGDDFRSKLVPNLHGSTDVFGDASLNNTNAFGELGIRRKVYGLTALGNFQLSDSWSLSTITGLRKFNSLENFDADGSQVNLLNFEEHSRSHQASQEVRFNFDNGGKFTGFFGADFFYENGSEAVPFATDERSMLVQLIKLAPTLSPSAAPIIQALFGPTPPPLLLPNNQPNQPYSKIPLLGYTLNPDEREGYANYGSTRSYELFADGTYRFNDQFDITGGLRASRESLWGGYQVFNASGVHASGIGPALSLLGIGLNGITEQNILFRPTNGLLTQQSSDNSVVGRLIGTWHIDSDNNAYLSVSRGRRPSVMAFNLNAAGNGYDASVLPAETIWSYEAGLKGSANQGRFAYDVSAYYYDYRNFQSNAYEGGRLVTIDAGRAKVPGLEVSLQEAFTDNLSAFFNYSYEHARFAGKDEAGQNFAGNHLRLAPDQSAAIGVLWNLPLDDQRAFYFRPSYTWRSKTYFEDNNPNYTQGAYGLFNLRTGVTFDRGRWDVALWGANLANKKYLIDGGNTGENFDLPTYIPGSPRTFGVSVSGKF